MAALCSRAEIGDFRSKRCVLHWLYKFQRGASTKA
ncbi:hypothetical protein SLEP1_g32826 [Rubroshorea leprosula]|uniref:Uncharacterized protein n=1 Tax=Rubroshorea leprosula TaxID=152421 RepID=A0AAV5KES3_9ROSI|nr:hypothetical protein SLEP1_g32826 [Rubroshorea leprosula]